MWRLDNHGRIRLPWKALIGFQIRNAGDFDLVNNNVAGEADVRKQRDSGDQQCETCHGQPFVGVANLILASQDG